MNSILKTTAKILLFVTLYPLSFFIRRNDELWVFGSYQNKFLDNSKYMFLWMAINAPKTKTIWISGSRKTVTQLRSLGYEACLRWSPKGLAYCLRAGVYVYSAYLRDINFYTSGRTKRVNLWHGVGLKKIEFKIKEGKLKSQFNPSITNPYRIIQPDSFARPDILLSTSPLMTEHFSECFRINQERCFQGTYPRLLLHKDSQLLEQALKFGNYKKLQDTLKSFPKRWIYMPTWRDDGASGIKRAIPDAHKLNASLALSNTLLFIKIHPNEKVENNIIGSNIRHWDESLDIYPMLPMFDGLITDYSSILYDFLALGKNQVILYNYDYKEYIENSRDFAYPYLENTTGLWVDNFVDLCAFFESGRIISDDKASTIRTRFFNPSEASLHGLIKAISRQLNSIK